MDKLNSKKRIYKEKKFGRIGSGLKISNCKKLFFFLL